MTLGGNLKQLVAIRFIEQFRLPEKRKEKILLESKFEFAKELLKAGQYILRPYGKILQVETKTSGYLVTRLDKEVQELLVVRFYLVILRIKC